jgi:hypothetical protein
MSDLLELHYGDARIKVPQTVVVDEGDTLDGDLHRMALDAAERMGAELLDYPPRRIVCDDGEVQFSFTMYRDELPPD